MVEANAKFVVQRAHGLSPRGYARSFKVARTMADFECFGQIWKGHIATAFRMRSLDRK